MLWLLKIGMFLVLFLPIKVLLSLLGLMKLLPLVAGLYICILTTISLLYEDRDLPTFFTYIVIFVGGVFISGIIYLATPYLFNGLFVIAGLPVGSITNHLADRNTSGVSSGEFVARMNAVGCPHSDWLQMAATSADAGAMCDYIILRSGNPGGIIVIGSTSERAHNLGSMAQGGDIYYVCKNCFTTSCNPCYQAMKSTGTIN